MFSVVSHCFTPKRWGRLSGVNDYFFWLVQPSSIYETRCQQHCLIYLDIACTQRCPKPWLRMMRIKRRIRTRRPTERAKPPRTRPGDPIILPHPLGPMANRGAMGPTLAPWRSDSFRQEWWKRWEGQCCQKSSKSSSVSSMNGSQCLPLVQGGPLPEIKGTLTPIRTFGNKNDVKNTPKNGT